MLSLSMPGFGVLVMGMGFERFKFLGVYSATSCLFPSIDQDAEHNEQKHRQANAEQKEASYVQNRTKVHDANLLDRLAFSIPDDAKVAHRKFARSFFDDRQNLIAGQL